MIRSSRKTVANGLLIGALALLIPAAAGCEAGLNAPTLEYHHAAGGAYTEVNGISISNAFVLGGPNGEPVPPGSSASLFLSLYNGGTGNDTLVSVSAPAASSVQVTGGTVSLPVSSAVNLMGPQPSVVLGELTKPLSAGQAIPVTLNFEHAGTVTLDVPVVPQSFYYSTFSPPPSAAPASAGPSGSATPKTTKASGTPTP